MEEPRQEAGVGAYLSSPSHRQSHLRSGTYRNLVRLISLCYGDSPLATAPPIIPLSQTPDNGGNRGAPGGDDVGEPGGSIVSDTAVFQDKGFEETQMSIDEIEQIMGMEEGQDLVNQNDMIVGMEDNGFRDGEIGREQLLMADLENIMKGNEDCDKISNSSTATLVRNQGDNCAGILSNDGPPVIEESGTVGQLQVDTECGHLNIIDLVGFSSDKNSTVEVSKSSEKVKDQSSSLETNLMHKKDEIQQKMEPEKFVCSNEGMFSSAQMVKDGEVEEGEIFGENQLVNESIDVLLDDAVASEKRVDAALVSEKRVEEKQISGGISDDKHSHCNYERTVNDKTSEFTFFNTNVAPIANKVTPREPEGSEADQMVYELGMMQREKGSGKIREQIGSKNQIVKSKMKKDVGVSNEKRQSLTPAEKKEKKKRHKRKKRAEKNRQLGVKRLKLQTVLKPKPVTYCRHYLRGRCHEGEKCKFSHDTVPLTKAQPCSHFARQSCMKGDDCPFDHQLSKYPCNNYKTKGSCSRGDDCLFSHKMPLETDVASSSIAPEHQLKPSSQCDSDMRLNISRALLKNVDASFYSAGAFSDKSKRQIVADTPTRTPDLACKGVNSPFVSKSSIAESIKLKHGSSSQKMNENQRMLGINSPFASRPSPGESSKFGQGSSSLKMNESGRLGIQVNRSESHAFQNVNGSPKKKPEVVPRGINFLSFGKSSLEDSTGKVSLELNRAGGYKQQPSDNEGDRVKLSNRITESTSSTDHKKTHPVKLSNRITESTSSTDHKKTHPALLSPGINLTVGDLVNSGSNAPASLPRCSDNVNNGVLPKINYAADTQPSSSYTVTPQTPGRSSEWLAYKGMPNSAREALISTLTMAKKFDNVKGKSVRESQQLSDKQHNSNANPWKMPSSLLATGQSSENITPKSAPNSSQKTLMSTLAFAKMFESGMKKSATRTAVSSETGDSRTGEVSKTDAAKTSKLLDMLSSVSSKIKN